MLFRSVIYGTHADVIYHLKPGMHTTTVLDQDENWNDIHLSSVTYKVDALTDGLQIISPTPDETISMSTVHVVAHANESAGVSQMQVWDNGTKLGTYPGADVNQYFNLSPGLHTITVVDLDRQYYTLHQSSVSCSVQ